MPEPTLLVIALVFAVITGANDGGALLSSGLKFTRSLGTPVAVGILAVTVAVGPIVFGTQVATTFTHRLVNFEGAAGEVPIALGIVSAVVVVAALTVLGLPTSLTLAVVGGLTGAGIGYGLPVEWGGVGFVLLVGIVAPLAGGFLAFAISRLSRHALMNSSATGLLSHAHRVAFGVQCFAYSVNDGQKMLAVFAAATGAAVAPIRAPLTHVTLLAVLFAIGVILGLRRVARSLGNSVLAMRPIYAVSAELAAAAMVLGTAAIGAPVSMTQALTGGLVGAGMSHGYRRVRWHAATKIAMAWILTLPTSVGLAAAFARAASGIVG